MNYEKVFKQENGELYSNRSWGKFSTLFFSVQRKHNDRSLSPQNGDLSQNIGVFAGLQLQARLGIEINPKIRQSKLQNKIYPEGRSTQGKPGNKPKRKS